MNERSNASVDPQVMLTLGASTRNAPYGARVRRTKDILSWTESSWGECSGFMGTYAWDFLRDICVIRGEEQNRIFTTDNTEYTDESQRPHKTCSLVEGH